MAHPLLVATQSINLVQLAQNLPPPTPPHCALPPNLSPLKELQVSFLPISGFHDIYFENHCPWNVIQAPQPRIKGLHPRYRSSAAHCFPVEVTMGGPVPPTPHSCLLDLLFCISRDHFNSGGLKDHSLLSECLPDCLKVSFLLQRTLGPCRAQLAGSEGSRGRIG